MKQVMLDLMVYVTAAGIAAVLISLLVRSAA